MTGLLLCIVPQGFGQVITSAANNAGSGGGTIVMARGLSESKFAQLLAIGDTSKDVVYIVVSKEKKQSIKEAIINSVRSKPKKFGSMMTVDVLDFDRTNTSIKNGGGVSMESDHKIITVIANKGYSDDIMKCAREAGASGGTIINARGTAQPDDEKFLGLEIVPEKEMILIIASNDNAPKIMAAIQELDCLSKPGSGIVFTVPVQDHVWLGQ